MINFLYYIKWLVKNLPGLSTSYLTLNEAVPKVEDELSSQKGKNMIQ
jgi:hypothetical protein